MSMVCPECLIFTPLCHWGWFHTLFLGLEKERIAWGTIRDRIIDHKTCTKTRSLPYKTTRDFQQHTYGGCRVGGKYWEQLNSHISCWNCSYHTSRCGRPDWGLHTPRSNSPQAQNVQCVGGPSRWSACERLHSGVVGYSRCEIHRKFRVVVVAQLRSRPWSAGDEETHDITFTQWWSLVINSLNSCQFLHFIQS